MGCHDALPVLLRSRAGPRTAGARGPAAGVRSRSRISRRQRSRAGSDRRGDVPCRRPRAGRRPSAARPALEPAGPPAARRPATGARAAAARERRGTLRHARHTCGRAGLGARRRQHARARRQPRLAAGACGAASRADAVDLVASRSQEARRRRPTRLRRGGVSRRAAGAPRMSRRGERVRGSAPRATYRLQLNASFGLADAARLVPYVSALGVSHVYCSPYLRARAGSTHGYDIVDHNAINPELGGTTALGAFVGALRRHRMGHVLDFVPNHMGVAQADNPWWLEVLEWGPVAPAADWF